MNTIYSSRETQMGTGPTRGITGHSRRPQPQYRPPQSRNNDSLANVSSESGKISQRSSRLCPVHTSASHSHVSSCTGNVRPSPCYSSVNRSLYDTLRFFPRPLLRGSSQLTIFASESSDLRLDTKIMLKKVEEDLDKQLKTEATKEISRSHHTKSIVPRRCRTT